MANTLEELMTDEAPSVIRGLDTDTTWADARNALRAELRPGYRALQAALQAADEYILANGVEEDGACYVCNHEEDQQHEADCPLVGARNREWQRFYANQAKAEVSRD